MAINRIEIKDFLVFKGEFDVDFVFGVNVLIGGNGTGKTTLLKAMYGLVNEKLSSCFYTINAKDDVAYGDRRGSIRLLYGAESSVIHFQQGVYSENMGAVVHPLNGKVHRLEGGFSSYGITGKPFDNPTVYIPEKDMLSHSIGMLALKHERPTVPFDDTLTDIIAKAQLYPKKEKLNDPLCAKIREIIGGEVAYDNDTFIIIKDKNNGQSQVAFSMEASGYKKLGLLWKLIRNGLLESGAILFWDEPENSLNPELVPVLVGILLELSRNGVQIFIATHSELLASYFAVSRQKGDAVMFYSLYKDGEQIKYDRDDRFDLLEPNTLTEEPVRLYEKQIVRGLGGNE
ncbi:MAG: AAA family ATPase [Peptococcaceae bacterium]|jgi:AAA15 family ATPase/GTPase|nr:AAA family ATPase [Peptococcaceae bacterium]